MKLSVIDRVRICAWLAALSGSPCVVLARPGALPPHQGLSESELAVLELVANEPSIWADAPPPNPSTAPVPLEQATPPDDGNDWVELTNGEWLQGKLLAMRDDSVEFDSDHFDTQELDLADVQRLFIRTRTEFVLLGRKTITGTGTLVGGQLTIDTAHGPERVGRYQLIGMVRAVERERQHWTGNALFGLNVSRGNSQQTTVNGSSTVKREAGFTRLWLDYLGNYGVSRGVRTAHNHRGQGELDLFLSHGWFVTPLLCTAEYDRLKNIRARVMPALGGGVRLIDAATIDWSVRLVSGYLFTRFFSVEQGADESIHHMAVAAATTIDLDVTEDIDFHFDHTTALIATEIELSTHHTVAELSDDLGDYFDVKLRLIWDLTSSPIPREDGTRPRKNDLQLIAALGVELD